VSGFTVCTRTTATEPDASGNLFLTNIHHLYEWRDQEWTPQNAVDALLGKKPVKDLAAGQRSMLERIKSLKDLVVLNDEAHHVHDEDLKWSQSLLAIHRALPKGVGLWLEGVLSRQDFEFFPLRYQKTFTLGLDYTFGLGNGLHIMGEHLTFQTAQKIFGPGEMTKFSAISVDYPLMLTDRIKSTVLRNWETGDWYRFITWQRMTDRWSFYLIAFWNPDRYQIYASQTGKSLFAGKGLEIMVVFNH
jgi:hypothetical protein